MAASVESPTTHVPASPPARPPDLPDFADPPLVEVILGVRFKPVTGLTVAHLGAWWQECASDFPDVEEHPPLEPAAEQFDDPAAADANQLRIQISTSPPRSRVLFFNAERTQLLQMQNDRFLHNWIQVEDSPYPRYEAVREAFAEHLQRFATFLKRRELGDLAVTQCEVAYVNHIRSGDDATLIASDILAHWTQPTDGSFLAAPDSVMLSSSWRIPDHRARLHLDLRPIVRPADNQPVWNLVLTARGQPARPTIPDALSFLNHGREWIVRGFADLTTDSMHRFWSRTR